MREAGSRTVLAENGIGETPPQCRVHSRSLINECECLPPTTQSRYLCITDVQLLQPEARVIYDALADSDADSCDSVHCLTLTWLSLASMVTWGQEASALWNPQVTKVSSPSTCLLCTRPLLLQVRER